MTTVSGQTRRYAAVMVQRHFEGTLTLEALMEQLAYIEDPLIQMTLDAVARQPGRGFLGATERHWERVYWPRMSSLIRELEKGAMGVAPPCPIYPVATLGRILGLAAVALYVVASAADHGLKLWRHISGVARLATWEALMSGIAALILGICAVTFIRALLFRISLYRGQRSYRAGGGV